MADVTPNHALPFLEYGDPPDLAAGTEDLALAVDAKLVTAFGQIAPLTAQGIQIIRKTTDTSRASTTTATADPHLTFAAAANTKYRFRAVGFFTVEGGNSTVDIKIGLTFPSGALATFGCDGPDPAIAGGQGLAEANWYAYLDASVSSVFAVGVSNNVSLATKVVLEGTVRTAATAGSVSVIWAQVTSSANALYLRANSYLETMKVA